MARTAIPVVTVSRANPLASDDGGFPGVDSDPTNGHRFQNDGRTLIYAASDAAAPVALNFHVQQRVDGRSVTDLVVWVAAGEVVFVGPFPTAVYNGVRGGVTVDVGGDAEDISLIGISIGH